MSGRRGLPAGARARFDEAIAGAGRLLTEMEERRDLRAHHRGTGEIVEATGGQDVPEARDLEEAYQAEVTAAGDLAAQPPALR